MFIHCTDDVRKNMARAIKEAGAERDDELIHSEHVFLGLVANGAAAAAVRGLDADLQRLQTEFREGVNSGQISIQGTPHGKVIIESAVRAAESLNHELVGDEHLLLALAEVEGPVRTFLLNKGISYDPLQDAVAKLPDVGERRT